MANIKVTLGERAYSFSDQATGIFLARGEVKELTPRQYSTKRIQRAISQGHLRLVLEAVDKVKKYSEKDIEKLTKRLQTAHGKGQEPAKVAKAFSFEELKLVAEKLGFEVAEDDTVESLIKTIFEDFEDGNKE